MDIEKLEEILNHLKKIKSLQDSTCKECCEEEEECEIFVELKQEYADIMKWSFGITEPTTFTPKNAIKKWKQLHPDLPIPRILQSSEVENSAQTIVFLILDICPLYRAAKK